MKEVLYVRNSFVMKLLLLAHFLLVYWTVSTGPDALKLPPLLSPALHLQLLTAKYVENLKYVPVAFCLWPILWSVSDICGIF
jgi:hypothetical protein